MSVRKYFTEFAVNMLGTYRVILQQDNLEDPHLPSMLPADADFHIYMICSRPRIGWEEASLKFTEDTFSGVFTVQNGNTFEKHDFTTPNNFGTSELTVKCPYPHNEYGVFDSSDTRIAGGKVAFALGLCGFEYWEHLDLEVLYIGQSYGEEGSRVAPDRLKSHSTLQGIYAEAIKRSPDKDIWIVLWSFEPMLITSMDGTQKIFGTTHEEDKEHREKVISTPLTEQQQINFTEAALIRYFQPEYNVIFKNTFPSPAHKTYSECYDLDLNSINVELQTEDIMCRLWSPNAAKTWTHFAMFNLHSPEERRGMFEFAHEG